MSVTSWFKSVFGKRKEQSDFESIEPIPILRTETPQKIIETKIKPVKIPTILDIGERLALISNHLGIMKDEMVSKSWFKTEYEYAGSEFIDKISTIEMKLDSLEDIITRLNDLINNLSNLNKSITKGNLINIKRPMAKFTISNEILDIIVENKKIRYKDIRANINVSDPTLCKYLKILLKAKKIKRIQEGKSVFYTPI
jgi:hypothetical protein